MLVSLTATADKYNALAENFGLWDAVFFYPRRFRTNGADALGDIRGKRVLEVGCGSGLNFKYLVERVGPAGAVTGIDLSKNMIGVARTRCERNLWNNVSVHTADAISYRASVPFDAVYFGLSFTILEDPHKVIDNILGQLKTGGRLVVIETRIPKWMPRFLEQRLNAYAFRKFGTVSDTKPWKIFDDYEQRCLLKNVTLETVRSYSFYVLSAQKS